MSVWGKILDQGCGIKIKKEDDYLENLKRMIKDVLSSHKVCPDGDPPIKNFFIDIEEDGGVQRYMTTLAALEHRDEYGKITRDFNSLDNLERILELLKRGKIIHVF